jgi:hypothetical protein
VGVTLAAAELAADHGQVGGDQVDRLAAVVEVRGERGDEAGDVVGVGGRGLGRGQVEHLRRPHRVALGQERQRRQSPVLALAGDAADDVVLGLAQRSPQRDAGLVGPAAQRVQPCPVVVVARDHHDRGGVTAQRAERPYHDLLHLGAGRDGVVEVAGHDHEVGLLGLGDGHDVTQDQEVFVHTRLSLEDLADVPVGGVQQLHTDS